MFPDTLLGITADLMRPGLRQKLALVGSLYATMTACLGRLGGFGGS